MVDVANLTGGGSNLAARVTVATSVDLSGLEAGMVEVRLRLNQFDQQLSGSFRKASGEASRWSHDMSTAVGKAAKAADSINWKGPQLNEATKGVEQITSASDKAAKGVGELKKQIETVATVAAPAAEKAAQAVDKLRDQAGKLLGNRGEPGSTINWGDQSKQQAHVADLKSVAAAAAKAKEALTDMNKVPASPLKEVAEDAGGAADKLDDVADGANAASSAVRLLSRALPTLISASAGISGGLTIAGGIFKANQSYQQSVAEVRGAAEGLGRAVALSITEMERAAEAGSEAANITVQEARKMEVAFLRTGRISGETFEDIIALSRNFGATLGVDIASAGQQLAGLFSDPAAAARKLYFELGLIDEATSRTATNLAQQGRQTEAVQVILANMPKYLADADNATGRWVETWRDLRRVAMDALDAVGRGAETVTEKILRSITGRDVRSPSQQLEDSEAVLRQLQSRRAQMEETGATGGRALQRSSSELSALDQLIAAEEHRISVLRDLVGMQEENARLEKEAAEERRRGAEALGIAQASPAVTGSRRKAELEGQIEVLRRERENVSLTADARKEVNEALQAKERVLDALNTKDARAIELVQMDVKIQNELNPILRANLAADRERLALQDAEISSSELERRVLMARQRIVEDTIASGESNATLMQQEASIRRTLNDQVTAGTMSMGQAERALQVELELRPLLAAAAAAEGSERERLLNVIKELRQAHGELNLELSRTQAQASIQNQRDRLELLQTELGLLGEGRLARDAALQTLKTEQEIRRSGLPLYGAEAEAMRELTREINANSEAMARSQLQQEAAFEMRQMFRNEEDQAIASRLRSAGLPDDLESQEAEILRVVEQAKRLKDTWEDVFSTARDGIDSLVDSLFDGTEDIGETLKKIGRDFARMAFDLAVTNPLKNWLTGSDLNTIADLGIFGNGASSGRGGGFGGVLGNLLGAQKAVASMQVQAAVVNINGVGLGSLLPGLGAIPGLIPGASGIPGIPGVGNLHTLGSGQGVAGLGSLEHILGLTPAGKTGRLPASQDFIQRQIDQAFGTISQATIQRQIDQAFRGLGGAGGVGSNLLGLAPYEEMVEFAKQAALARNIDPNVALNLMQHEGLQPGIWQSNVINSLGRRETSFGPMQLLRGGGLGDAFMRETGLDVADPSTWRQNIEFGLNKAAEGGTWAPWFGRGPAGIGLREGLSGARSVPLSTMFGGDSGIGTEAIDAIDRMTTSSVKAAESLAQTATSSLDAASGLTDVTGGLGSFSNVLNSLSGPGGGGGLGIGNLISSAIGPLIPGSQAARALASGGGGLYQEGGFTGLGSRNEPRGIVHAGEVVWSQDDISRSGGVQAVEAMRRRGLRSGFANGGYTSGPVVPSGNQNRAGVSKAEIEAIVASMADKLQFNNKNINLLDPRLVGDFMKGPRGEKVTMNVIRRNGGPRQGRL